MFNTKLLSITISITLIFLSACATQQLTEEQKTISIVKEAKGSKDELFDATKIWIAETFNSAKAVIEFADKEKGTIIGNGTSKYPCTEMCFGSYKWSLHYSMRVDFKDDRYKVTFTNLELSWPASYSNGVLTKAYRGAVASQGDYEAIKTHLLGLADNLDNSIHSESKSSDW